MTKVFSKKTLASQNRWPQGIDPGFVEMRSSLCNASSSFYTCIKQSSTHLIPLDHNCCMHSRSNRKSFNFHVWNLTWVMQVNLQFTFFVLHFLNIFLWILWQMKIMMLPLLQCPAGVPSCIHIAQHSKVMSMLSQDLNNKTGCSELFST